ncbi:MAG: ATP-binding cassette domain-containing protein [Streptosporangiaceae bacterium]|jgi:simple sugar transport system ATP-binding protein
MLSVKNIKKSYAGVAALRGVDIDLDVGLTAIVGDNGAGKSTLMKILSGVVRPDDGEIVIDGSPVTLDSPTRARSLGIESLYQDLALADTLDVASNVFLGRELVKRWLLIHTLDDKAMRRAAAETLKAVGIGIPDVKLPVRQLSGGQRQAVALARAMYFSAQVILLDEPTAALGPKETAAFTRVVREFVERRTTVCMVTHNLPQVMELADRIVVMRAGRVVATMNVSDVTEEQLLGLMVGSAAAV